MRRVLGLLLPLLLAAGLVTVGAAPAGAAAQCRRTLSTYPQLDPGDRSPAVRTLQCAINDLGLGPVVVDGYYGPQTKAALTPLVEAREGQPPHPYRLTPLFWHQLYGRQVPQRTLTEGDRGPGVRNLQRALRAWGFEIVVDGDFGAQTVRVLKEYQEVHQVPQTGRTDARTRYFLRGGDYY